MSGFLIDSTMNGWMPSSAPAPTVTSLTHTSGPWRASANGVAGTGFQSGATVTINGVACTSVVFNSSTSLSFNSPVETQNGGPYDVVVTNPDSQTGTLAAAYTVFFQADFTSLTPGGLASGASGGSAFETATGLRHSRASGATVQTSDRTIVSVASDVARIGQPSSSAMMRGLSFEETRTNFVFFSRDMTNGAWTAGNVTTETGSYANGPDGTMSATRVIKTGTNHASFQFPVTPASGLFTFSSWNKATDGVSTFASDFGGGLGLDFDQPVAVGPNWSRFQYTDATPGTIGVSDIYIVPVWNATVTGTNDQLIDLVQCELGKFATEAIVSGASNGVRADERLWHPDLSKLAVNGVLHVGGRFLPKGANGDYSFTQYLFFIDSSNKATIDTSGNVAVTLAGTTVTFSTPVTWAAYDLVEWFLDAGDGVTTTLTTWINGGSPTIQTTTALAHALSTGTIDLLCSGTTQQLSSIVQILEVWP